jgi:hypothetical protein
MYRLLTRSAAAMTLLSMSTAAFAQGTSPAFADKPFTDVPEGSAGYEGIEFLRQGNVLTGYEDGTFKPDNRLNRAEFAKLIANPFILKNARVNDCLNENVDQDDMTVFFPDVQRDAWYAPSVCVVRVAKIVNGYDDGTYKPNRTINVAEAMKMLASTFAFDTKTEPDDAWYMPYARALAERNAIPSSIDNFSDPITRGEMAEILYRLKADRQDKASQSIGNIRAY